MEKYRITGVVGHETNSLTLQQEEGQTFKIAFGGKRSHAALFLEDRQVLEVARFGGSFVWRMTQDGVLRAAIMDRIPGLVSLALDGASTMVSLALGQENSILPVNLGRNLYRVRGSATAWEIKIYTSTQAMAGRFQRLADGCLVEVEENADRFLVLGMAVLILAAMKEEAVEERYRRETQHSYVHVTTHAGRPRRPRSQPSQRRKWIDDPVQAPPQRRREIHDPLPDLGKRISDPVLERVRDHLGRKLIDQPVPERRKPDPPRRPNAEHGSAGTQEIE